MQTLFITSLLIIFYSYLGYGLIIWLISKIRRKPQRAERLSEDELPSVAVLIPAYNEEDIIADKIENTLSLEYPKDKKEIIVITDGSSDQTQGVASNYEGVTVLHKAQRGGKIAAVNRAMALINQEITVSTDANTMLNKEALLEMVKHFADDQVAAVSGEKKITTNLKDDAAASGEGLYWKYESFLKRLDSEVNTLVGAAGELIAYRTKCYKPIPQNMIIEDFYMTMKFCEQGYKVAYEPKAFAKEAPSASVKEEMKRKIRICAGGHQAIVALKHLLNPFKFGMLTFQYVSHRVLRWTAAPIALLTLFVSSILLATDANFFLAFSGLQVFFYGIAMLGYYLKTKKISVKLLHIPYYFCMMNYAVYAGFFRFIKGQQTVLWEKATRRI